MKIFIAILITFFLNGLAEAKCQPTNARAKLEHGNTVNLYILVFKNSDCIFSSKRYKFEKVEIASQPKNGKAGINSADEKIIYVPNNGFVGEDTVTYRVFYKNDKGEVGSSTANIIYTVM